MPHLLVVDLAATSRNWSLPEEGRARISDAAPPGWRVHFISAPTVSDGDGGRPPSAETLAAVADAEAYFGFGLSKPVFEAGRKLRWVHSAAAGVGAALFPEMVASDVALTNSAGIYGSPIAQHVLGGVLHFLRGFDIAVALQRESRWDKAPFVGDDSSVREAADCDVLVIGAGGLGSAIARALTALGARCVGVRRRPERGTPEGFERVVGPGALDRELADAQVVVLATPSTAETKELLDRNRIERLRTDAIVVNVGRGSLLDEEALADALEAGRLRGAVLDVFREEPLASSSRLWQLRNVLITPHVSGVSPLRYWGRQLDLFIDNWTRFAEGRPLRNLVDKRAGY
ncbi:MAG TPA: D-2-hydroxyacid dehydrogenase [Gemmatimonadaceae bacterium]|nr:D-2-hydroxyacid dehydrogenase [Gemmatimonadaceae bacterium]